MLGLNGFMKGNLMRITSFGGVISAALLGLVLAGTGCESDGGHAKGTHTMPDGTVMAGTSHELMCPKCETVWTSTLTDQGMKSQRLVSKSGMTCPTCDNMAAAYMKDGEKVLHDCPECKVTPVVLKPTTPTPMPRGPHGNG